MLFVGIGVFGFLSLLLFDFMSIKDRIFVKYLFAILGLGLIVFSTIELLNFKSDFDISSTIQIISLVLAIIFMMLLIYSVFIEVGGNTYKKIAEPQLVTNGTYSLVRHPGVIWLFLTIFFLALYSENVYLLISAITWTFVNTIYVVIQEKYIFIRLFPTYDDYMKTTPMIIPNYRSIKKFITIKNWRKE